MGAHQPMASVRGLAAFSGRGAGSDAERRAANWLAAECSKADLDVEIEPFWCRPNWALAQLWHVALAIAGSLIALASPIAGIVLLAVALAAVISDGLTGISPGRRLTPERASQNVIARPTAGSGPETPGQTRLILTANYDAGRIGLAYRLRPATTRLTRATLAFTPGWIGWLCLAMIWLLAVAILRQGGHTSHFVGAIQLPPTVGLLLAFALLLELAGGDWSPAAGDNASGVAIGLELTTALSETPPQHVAVEVVLSGAGDAEQIGLRRYLRARRGPRQGLRFSLRRRRAADMVVLGIGASSDGTPHWWQSDGSLLPLRYSPSLRRIAQRVADDEAFLQARPHRGRGTTPALPARLAGVPALTIGCLDATGLTPRSHHRTDVASAVNDRALDRNLQFALLLIDSIDVAVGADQRRPSPTPA